MLAKDEHSSLLQHGSFISEGILILWNWVSKRVHSSNVLFCLATSIALDFTKMIAKEEHSSLLQGGSFVIAGIWILLKLCELFSLPANFAEKNALRGKTP